MLSDGGVILRFPFCLACFNALLDGPWTKDNLVTAVEFFFQRNAYHPFAQCSHPQKHSDPVPLTETLPNKAGANNADRKMLHYCPHQS